jgi:vanillate O-demethylase ferredoxin subunit
MRRSRTEFAPLTGNNRVVLHYDGGIPANGLDIAGLLSAMTKAHISTTAGRRVSWRRARAASDWPAGSVHFEYFTAASAPRAMSGAEIDGPASTHSASAFR